MGLGTTMNRAVSVKTGKVLEFFYGIFQDWKVLEKRPLVLGSSE